MVRPGSCSRSQCSPWLRIHFQGLAEHLPFAQPLGDDQKLYFEAGCERLPLCGAGIGLSYFMRS